MPANRSACVAALLVLAGAAVLLTGCGGSSSIGVASIATSTVSRSHLRSSSRPGLVGVVVGGGTRFVGPPALSPAQRAQNQVSGLLYSRCMRAHGVPGYPDPPASAGGAVVFGFGGAGQIDPGAPLFRVANRTCLSILIRNRPGLG